MSLLTVKDKNTKPVIFSIKIDFKDSIKNEGYTLNKNAIYDSERFLGLMKFLNYDYPQAQEKSIIVHGAKIKSKAIRVIDVDLRYIIGKKYGFPAEIEILGTKEGSIIIFLSIYTIISQYKSFIESLELIKNQITLLVKESVNEDYTNDIFDVDTSIEHNPISYKIHSSSKRDGFFYFIFIGFILLLIVLGILVYHSFMLTYFK